MKVVFDTMMWVSFSLSKDGYRHRLVMAASKRKVRLFVSGYILDELSATLQEDFGRSHRYATLARQAVLRLAKPVDLPSFIPRYVPGDPDDDPIAQTALAAKADYLVTSDRELLRVRRIEDIEIITPTDFQQRLGISV